MCVITAAISAALAHVLPTVRRSAATDTVLCARRVAHRGIAMGLMVILLTAGMAMSGEQCGFVSNVCGCVGKLACR